MTFLRTPAALAIAACTRTPPPIAPPPVAVLESASALPVGQQAMVATVEEPNVLDNASFQALLRRDDWSALIDPAIGFVALDQTPGATDPTKHEIEIRRRCGDRAPMWAKFEALSLAAQAISGPAVTCVTHSANLVECSHDHGRTIRFSFRRRGADFILAGIASFEPGTVSAADEQKYATELRGAGRCP